MRNIFLFVLVSSISVIGFKFSDQPACEQQGESPGSPSILQESEGNVGFEWAFGVLKKVKPISPVPITHDTVLKSGDEIKMMVKLKKECYVYVVYYGSGGEINLLFPYRISQLQTDYKAEKMYYIPKGRAWMKLDNNTGKEIFFLVASSERLLDLEVKVGNYLSAEPMDRKSLADEVLTEIRGLRRRYTTFATLAEKPITIGGNIRSTDTLKVQRRPDVADIATLIEANNFYSKTFTIDHQ